jgi:hypothetical protein
MNLEEEFQKPSIGGLLRVEDNLDRFSMSSMITVGGVRHVTGGQLATNMSLSSSPDSVAEGIAVPSGSVT